MFPIPPRHIVAACGLVTNDSGEILLVRTERRDWELPGGQVEEGETLTQALHREVQEEAGVVVEIDQLRVIHTNISRSILIFGFRASYLSGELIPQAGEIMDVRWVSVESALAMVTHPANLQRVRDILETNTGILYRAYKLDPFEIVETRAAF